MNKKILIILLMLSLQLFAQLDRSKMPEPGPAPEIKMGEVESFTLDNGLKVFVVENDKLPTIAVSLVIDRDPLVEGEMAGLTEAVGELMRSGTANRTKDQLNEEIDFIGARLSTSSSRVYGSALSKHSEKLMELLSDIIINPNFTEEELELVKNRTISALTSAKDSPSQIASQVRRALVFGLDHPYGEQQTEETTKAITLEKCKEYYSTYVKPNISYMAIVGDISKGDAEDLVNEYFAKWEKAEVPTHTYENKNAPLVNKVAMVNRDGAVQSVITITYPVELKPDSEDLIKASVMNSIYGGGFSSRINQNLREDKGYTYGARSALAQDELIGSFRATCEARNSVTDSAITEFLNEMKGMIAEVPTEEELSLTKNYMMGSFSRSLENAETVARFALNIQRYGLDEDYYKDYLQNLSKVTAEDVHEMAKKYIKPENSYIVVVGNADQVADNLKKFTLSGKIDYYDMYGNKVDPNVKKLPEGVTAENVIDNYFKALGGKEKLAAVTSLKTEVSASMAGMEIKVSSFQKDGKFYSLTEVAGMRMEETFDGTKGVKTTPQGMVNYTEEEILDSKYAKQLFPLLRVKDFDVKTELVSMENVEGTDCFKLNVTQPSGKVKTYWFDAETYLPVQEATQQETPQGPVTVIEKASDYVEYDGIMVPTTHSVKMGPQTINMKVKSVEFNTEIDDAKFEIK